MTFWTWFDARYTFSHLQNSKHETEHTHVMQRLRIGGSVFQISIFMHPFDFLHMQLSQKTFKKCLEIDILPFDPFLHDHFSSAVS